MQIVSAGTECGRTPSGEAAGHGDSATLPARDGVHDAYRRYKKGEIDAEEACEVVKRLRSQPLEPENRDDFSILDNFRAEKVLRFVP